ncbi:MAG TPA: sigma-70 family RNA polymerase sigma factor [Candidatus Dormibacteraeota bacterium]|nr:sigma-70 family RNA polymerase sigma factor [Candidatus Dormibacteraeota bacterium]
MIGIVAGDATSDPAVVDSAAFTAQLEAALDAAHRLATVMLRDRGAAEDAVQEAALKAWRKHGQLRGGEAGFRGWFLSIVANECRMARRTRWWRVVRFAEPPEPAPMDDGGVTSGELRAAVLRLEPGDRAALFCFFYLDMPMEEVARVLGISRSAARSRVYRAARRLRPELDPEDLR